jgi:hypothetical protein
MPDWIEIYCKDDGNNGNGVYIEYFEVYNFYTTGYKPSLIKTFKTNTFIRTGEFIVISEGHPNYDELSSGADNVITTYSENISLSSTDNMVILKDFAGNVYDVVIYAQDDPKEKRLPIKDGILITGATAEPYLSFYDEKIIYDVARSLFAYHSELSYKIIFSSPTYYDPKVNLQHWYGEDTACKTIKFFPNLLDDDPNIGYVNDWVYTITYAVDSAKVKEGYSISRDKFCTDTNTRLDWHITDKPTFGRPDDQKKVGIKIRNLVIEPNPFLNDASDINRYYTEISFELTAEGVVSIFIFDIKGREVKKLVNKQPVMMGRFKERWIGNDNSHCPVPIGPYIIYIEVRNEYSTDVKKKVIVVAKKF